MHVAQNWRINGQRLALKGAQCQHCGKVSFPARGVCPHCEAQEQTKPTLTLIAHADVHPAQVGSPLAWQLAAR